MSSPLLIGSLGEFANADRLRNELVDFVVSGPLKKEFDQQRLTYFRECEKPDDSDWEAVLDWFLFDWFDEGGCGVIDHFLGARSDLEQSLQDILVEWQDSLNSVFHVKSVSKSALALRDLESGYNFNVTLTKGSSHELFKKGEYVVARLLALGDNVILSGLQYIMPDRKSAMAWLEMRNKVDELHSPEEIEKAVQESCKAFCDLFGCDELTVPSEKLLSTLRRFQEYLLRERRLPESGVTAAERYRAEVGRELDMSELPVPPEMFPDARDVTLLCDDFDGIVVLPDFSRFKRVFTTDDPDHDVPEWKDLVWSYIKNPDIPIVAFERVAEKHPKRVEKVLRCVLGNSQFSLEHMYAALLHYKEPVEGLDDLEDEQHLWDLFNGNAESAKASSKPRRRKTPAAKTTRGRSTTTKKQAAGVARGKPKPSALLSAKRKVKSASTPPKLNARSSTSARKSTSTRRK